MALDTYANLKTAIADHLDMAEASLALDDFIDVVEADLNKRLRVPEMLKRATAAAPTSSRFLAVPTGYLEMKKLRVNSTVPHQMVYIAPPQIEKYYVSTQGKPNYYTVIGDELEFNRTFDSAYTLEMHYYKIITALDGTNTSNDILTTYPGIYLYGCLALSAPYLGEDQRLGVWAAMYEGMIKGANDAAKADQINGAPLQMRHDSV